MDDKDLKRLVNKILARKNIPPVKNLAAEFSDGSKSARSLPHSSLSSDSPFPRTFQHPERRVGELSPQEVDRLR